MPEIRRPVFLSGSSATGANTLWVEEAERERCIGFGGPLLSNVRPGAGGLQEGRYPGARLGLDPSADTQGGAGSFHHPLVWTLRFGADSAGGT